MRKFGVTLTIVLILGLVVFFILRAFSFPLALRMSGLNPRVTDRIEHSFDANGREFRVIKTESRDGGINLVLLTRNGLGFWCMESQSSNDGQPGPWPVSIGWIRSGGAKRFDFEENATFENEWHLAYYGNNAIKKIEFLPGQIPENVTVNIQQAGAVFSIHVVSFAEPDVLNRFNVPDLLIENHCIPAE